MARQKNTNWIVPEMGCTIDQAQLAVLMDIRDELQRLNALLHCETFLAIPRYLRSIDRKTTRKRRRAK